MRDTYTISEAIYYFFKSTNRFIQDKAKPQGKLYIKGLIYLIILTFIPSISGEPKI